MSGAESTLTDEQIKWSAHFVNLDIAGSSRADPLGADPLGAGSPGAGAPGGGAPGGGAPGGAGKQSKSPPRGAKTINFDSETIEVDVLTAHEIKAIARSIEGVARTSANTAGINILNACLTFQNFSKDRLSEIHEEAPTLMKGLLEGLGSLALKIAGVGVLADVAEGIGHVIADKIADAVADGVVKLALAGVESSSKNAALEKAIGKLTTAAKDAGDAYGNAAIDILGPYIDKIIATADTAKDKNADSRKVLSQSQYEFIHKFADASTAMTDTYLAEIGIPDPAGRKSLELEVYKHLVKGFEFYAIKHEVQDEINDSRNPVYWKHEIARRAEDRASGAMSKRAEEMKQNEGHKH